MILFPQDSRRKAMYAVIASQHELDFGEITNELTKRGWSVFSKEFEQVDDIPSNTMVFMLYKCNKLGHSEFPQAGYLRIGTTENSDRVRVYVANSNWISTIYYRLALKWPLLRHLFNRFIYSGSDQA
jgi:hypothetical protein